jgi:hypothetical protein
MLTNQHSTLEQITYFDTDASNWFHLNNLNPIGLQKTFVFFYMNPEMANFNNLFFLKFHLD